MNPQAAIPTISSFESFEQILEPSFREFKESDFGLHPFHEDVVPYLETLTWDRGVPFADLEEMKNKAYKSHNCGKHLNKLNGYKTCKTYYAILKCMKWWCPNCGVKNGKVHKKRMKGIMEKIKANLNEVLLRQIIFTIPADSELEFMSKAALNSMAKMTEKIIKKFFPGLKCMLAVQLFGDRDKGRYRPHVHVLIFDSVGQLMMLPKEILKEINEKWRQAVQGLLRRQIKVVDCHYSFTTNEKQIKHKTKYTARLCPSYENYEVLKKNLPLLNFCMNTLSGFHYIRYFNSLWRKELNDEPDGEELRGMEKIVGEKLIFVPGEQISLTEFRLRYRPADYEELAPGFYRINGP